MTLPTFRLLLGDCATRLRDLDAESVQTVVTSPPYWGLRDYGVEGQIGLEGTPDLFVEQLVAVFQEVWRVLRPDGTLWLNLGDSYAGGGCGARDSERWPKQSRNDHMPTHAKKQTGLKPKDLVGIPWRVAFALQAAGWWLRSDIIWAKPNPMPESVADRPTRAHEYVFLLTKAERYFYDAAAIRDPAIERASGNSERQFRGDNGGVAGSRAHQGFSVPWAGDTRNKRSVWTITPQPYREAHFATFPEELVRPCVLAGSRPGDVVLDPFSGSGTTGVVAIGAGRSFVGCELKSEYLEMSRRRISSVAPLLAREVA